ncbi:hypothetical protein KCU81_g628, partial [Aureobasidium melanogenum]
MSTSGGKVVDGRPVSSSRRGMWRVGVGTAGCSPCWTLRLGRRAAPARRVGRRLLSKAFVSHCVGWMAAVVVAEEAAEETATTGVCCCWSGPERSRSAAARGRPRRSHSRLPYRRSCLHVARVRLLRMTRCELYLLPRSPMATEK